MKELFREPDLTRVSYFRNVLEAEGISTMIRNENLQGAGLNEIPIPEFFPALCVMKDEDYEAAVELVRQHLAGTQQGADKEVNCAVCGEINPGNFDVCWSCGGLVAG
ncbi:MAG: DUF2007 domain-containing protein [Verrucomicrobiota bacterium]